MSVSRPSLISQLYLSDQDAIAHTHPCLFLDPHFLASKGFPGAFTLSPSEAYELWFAGKHTFKVGEMRYLIGKKEVGQIFGL